MTPTNRSSWSTKQFTEALTPADDQTVNREVRVDIDPGWANAQEGDVLHAVAALKITAGVKTDVERGHPIVEIHGPPEPQARTDGRDAHRASIRSDDLSSG